MNWQPKAEAPPPGYRYGPVYRPRWSTVLRAVLYLLQGKPRSLARCGGYLIPDMPVPPLMVGTEHIPERGPLILVANHYERPGLWMAWPAIYAGHLVWLRAGQGPHWVAIEEWSSFRLCGIPIPPELTRRVFQRAFHTFGILGMAPPYASAGARAASLRAVRKMVNEGKIVGIMPEGDVGATPELLPAREGAGAFLLLLAHAGASLLPLGLYEQDERLVARFGAPFQLDVPADVPHAERDAWVRREVMVKIRDLLPPALWGVYR